MQKRIKALRIHFNAVDNIDLMNKLQDFGLVADEAVKLKTLQFATLKELKMKISDIPSKKIRYTLENPATEEGKRHPEAKDVARYLAGIGASKDDIIKLLSDAYPALIPRQGGQEIEKIASWAKNKIPVDKEKSEDTYKPKPISRMGFKIGTYVTPVHLRDDDIVAMPEPLPDPTSTFLKTLFKPDEKVCWNNTSVQDEDGKWKPAGSGCIKTCAEWITLFETRKGLYDTPQGAWFRINPTCGDSDEHVESFKYALVESDSMSLQEQYSLFAKSNLPIKTLTSSGGKSLHAIVEVNAESREQYKERVNKVYALLGKEIDPSCVNPSRYSRIAGFKRDGKMQNLIAVNIGAESWNAFEDKVELEELPRSIDIEELERFDRNNDKLSIFGKRWLCRGGSAILQGPSGIGKSTLTMQFAVSWAAGRSVFGIGSTHQKPLKISLIQAENDSGDLAEMFQDSTSALGLSPDEKAKMKNNLTFFLENVRTGDDFIRVFRNVALRTKADVIFVDPLLSFIGDDISDIKIVQKFMRNNLQPVLESTGVVAIFIHHIGKPKQNNDLSKLSNNDISYLGLGSSDLVNACREAITLIKTNPDNDYFDLVFSKRHNRLNLDNNGRLQIKHSSDGKLLWIEHKSKEFRLIKDLRSMVINKYQHEGMLILSQNGFKGTINELGLMIKDGLLIAASK